MYHPRKHARLTPDKPAYIMAKTGEAVTYGQLEERANRCSQYFVAIGLKPKDHIAILLENNSRFFEITWGAQLAGLVYTCVSTHLSAADVEYIINDCEAKALITSLDKADMAGGLLKNTPAIKHRLCVGGVIDGYLSYEETVAAYPATPIPEGIEGRDMLYSSGTTGRPKGVITNTQDYAFGEFPVMHLKMSHEYYKINEDTIYLSPAPLYHAAPLRFCMWTMRLGGTIIIMENFDAEWALALIEKYKVTTSQWVPTMFIRMLKLPESVRKKYNVSSLRMVIHAAAPCPVPIKEQMIAWWGRVINEYYSSTEGPTFTAITSEEWLAHKGSVGRAQFGKVHILDDNENELPLGEPGLICVEDGAVFEYHNDPKKTAESRTSRGWSVVGDIGMFDKDGYLYLTDRKADMIISGGVNIYPQESENILVTHPKVTDAAVFGIPNDEFGEEVKAVVQPTDMALAGPELEQELLAFCQQTLSKMKCPRSIDFQAELPRYPNGKLLKRLLKDRYWKDWKK